MGNYTPLYTTKLFKSCSFILIFLKKNLDMHGHSTAEHFCHPNTSTTYTSVKWKDPMTGQWHGQDPVLVWGQGHIWVFSQEENGAQWLPERLVRQMEQPHTPADSPTDDDVSCTW